MLPTRRVEWSGFDAGETRGRGRETRSTRYPAIPERSLPQRAEGDVYRPRPIIGSEFVGRVARKSTIGGRPAIVPIISGRGWITGVDQYMLDPADPSPSGYRLSDTWPRMREAI